MVDLYRMTPDTEHPHGLSHRGSDSLFTAPAVSGMRIVLVIVWSKFVIFCHF